MNIFVLDRNPRKAAQAHADKHVVKMILEAVQMLYTAHWIIAYPHLLENRSPIALSRAQKELPVPPSLSTCPWTPYRPVHIHHPCTKWARDTLANYQWLCLLAIAIGQEHQYRWPTHAPHTCLRHATWLLLHPPLLLRAPLTPFAIAMPIEYKHEDPVLAYRAYYCGSKTERGITKHYTRREAPFWLSE